MEGDKTGEGGAGLDLLAESIHQFDAQLTTDFRLGDLGIELVATIDKMGNGRGDGGNGLGDRPVGIDGKIDLIDHGQGLNDPDALDALHEGPSFFEGRLMIIIDNHNQLTIRSCNFLGESQIFKMSYMIWIGIQ